MPQRESRVLRLMSIVKNKVENLVDYYCLPSLFGNNNRKKRELYKLK